MHLYKRVWKPFSLLKLCNNSQCDDRTQHTHRWQKSRFLSSCFKRESVKTHTVRYSIYSLQYPDSCSHLKMTVQLKTLTFTCASSCNTPAYALIFTFLSWSLDVGGPADPIAPTIVIPPRNTSVISGTSEVTMECVANARWPPTCDCPF